MDLLKSQMPGATVGMINIEMIGKSMGNKEKEKMSVKDLMRS